MSVENEMLEELRRIREAVTPKPAPAVPPPRGLVAEFKAFIGKVVSALVQDIIMPIPGAMIPGGVIGGRLSSVYLSVQE